VITCCAKNGTVEGNCCCSSGDLANTGLLDNIYNAWLTHWLHRLLATTITNSKYATSIHHSFMNKLIIHWFPSGEQ